MKLAMYQGQPFLMKNSEYGQPILDHPDIISAAQIEPSALVLGEIQSIDASLLEPPITFPRQIFAVGMNYRAHSAEIKLALPKVPSLFTKFASSLTGPNTTVKIHGDRTDWETELVVVIGHGGRQIPVEQATDHIAGYMVGEDISDRTVQFANDPAQFSLGKSFEHYAPIGPWLTTPDELGDPTQLTITTRVNDETMQHESVSAMIFSPAQLISYLSQIVDLQPGDLIFTGTPQGTGVGHDPQIFLRAGDELTGEIDQLGKLTMKIQ